MLSGRAGWRTPTLHTSQLACVKALAENNSHCLGAATVAGQTVAAKRPRRQELVPPTSRSSHPLGVVPSCHSCACAHPRDVENRQGCSQVCPVGCWWLFVPMFPTLSLARGRFVGCIGVLVGTQCYSFYSSHSGFQNLCPSLFTSAHLSSRPHAWGVGLVGAMARGSAVY